MKEEQEDRRRHTRYPYTTRVWLETHPGAELEELTSVNISANGLLINAPLQLPLDSLVKILFELPFIPDPIVTVGRIVHAQETMFGEKIRLGVELVAVEGLTEDQLFTFLSDLLG